RNPSNFRGEWYLGRIHRRRCKDGAPLEGERKNLDAVSTQPKFGTHHAIIQTTFRKYCTKIGSSDCQTASRRRTCRYTDRRYCLSSCREGIRSSFRKKTCSNSRWRFYSNRLFI